MLGLLLSLARRCELGYPSRGKMSTNGQRT